MHQTSDAQDAAVHRSGDQFGYSASNGSVTIRHDCDGSPVLLAPITDGSIPALTNCTRLVEENLDLVGILVSARLRDLPTHVRRDELMSAGMIALVLSARAYKPERGVPFAKFAAFRIRGALIDELRTMDWAARSVRSRARDIDVVRARMTDQLGRPPSNEDVAGALGISTRQLDAACADFVRGTVLSLHDLGTELLLDRPSNHGDCPESLILYREMLGYLHDAVAALPDRLRLVVVAYFFAQRPMSDIARELGVSQSRVSQMCTEAVTLIRDGLNSQLDPEAVRTSARTVRSAAARSTYFASLATRNTVAGRLAISTLQGEIRPAVLAERVEIWEASQIA